MKDVKVRNEARKLLETSHMEVCYANQPRMFSGKFNVNAPILMREKKRSMR